MNLVNRFAFIAFLFVLTAACSEDRAVEKADSLDVQEKISEAPQADNSDDIPLGQLSELVEPTFYNLEIKLDPESPTFSGSAQIEILLKKPSHYFYIHGQDLTIKKASLKDSQGNENEISIERTSHEGLLKVIAGNEIAASSYTLDVDYQAPFNENLQGLYRVKDGDKYYAFTQMEAIYARYAFPSFDEPRFKTKYDISLIVPSHLAAIGNTPESEVTQLADGWKKVTFDTSKPMPTYLFAIAVGDFDIVEWQDMPANNIRNRAVPLRAIATKGKGEKLKYALENTQSIVEALEDYFQSEYPYKKLDILAVPDFAAGAMENPGAITYREQLLLLDDQSSISQKRRYKSIHAHELAHQWFGNLVTPVWWNDIWLNEAFATWMAGTALHRKWPDEQWKRQLISSSKNAMTGDSIPSARKVRNPVNSNGDIITAFDGITYSKGGGVLSMVESFMGEENFRLGVQKYMDKYQWKNADAIDFFETIASVLEPTRAEEVVKSFRNFVEQAGVPLLDISKSCQDEQSVLDISQKRYAPLGTEFKQKTLWNIPACMKYQVDGEIKQQCEILSKQKQQVKLRISGCADWVMPNQHAAGYYRFNFDSQGWKELLTNLDKMDAREANAILDSMQASFDGGNMTVQDLIDVIPSTLNSESWEVVVSGLATFGDLINDSEETDKNKLRQIAKGLYSDITLSLGLDDNTALDKQRPLDASQLRSRLVRFMALTVKDPEYRKLLTEKATQYVGYQIDNKIHDEVLISALRGTALSVAVQDIGQPFVDALVELLNQSTDGTLRNHLISGLISTEELDIAEQMMNLSLSENIRDNEKASFLFGMIGKKEIDNVTWPWFESNFDKLLSGLPTNYQSYIPYFFLNQCHKKNVTRLDEFLQPRLSELVGADKNFAKAKDYLQQCLARKDHVKPQIKALLAALN